jgi:hypothetical protein
MEIIKIRAEINEMETNNSTKDKKKQSCSMKRKQNKQTLS